MTCQEFVEFLMDYLAGDLTAAQRRCFEEHLGECPPCAHYVDTYKQTVGLCRAAACREDHPVPGDVPEDLVRAILAACQPRST